MNPYFELIRPNICLLSVFGLIAGLLLVGIPFELWLFPIVAVFLISASGNVINDYFDIDIDKINKPKRPLPSGRISKKQVIVFYICLSLIGLILSYFISVNFFILSVYNTILVFVYSLRFKKNPIGNIVDSWLACSVFIAPVLIFGGFEELIVSTATILAVIAFFGNYGREVLKDVEDMKGDKLAGAKTLPIIFGKNKAVFFGKLLISFSSFFMFVPYFSGIFSEFYLLFALVCFFVCLYILTIKDVSKAQKTTKALMFLVILAFLVGLMF
ncbi:MAG: geranylgeranylglycerol-phosphate geranylgeranyltransferase [Candidatus Aenigmarchaeota archaeon]|nr:geranylgeranylglycerol-phosphate geranylgeranyltransferase [Candidatus Aenigmarchaeota archaeon]